ncbi:MAG: hypothetical protein Q9162_001868 [Coniocarpon cinnabarinum]
MQQQFREPSLKRKPEVAPQNERNNKRRTLLSHRENLPIWSYQDSITAKLRDSSVLLLGAETGSGKSTQLPQFLLSQPWCTKLVAVTQPRRVAAISLAQRVAQEMGTTLGKQSPASRVGYSVRFDQNVGAGCRVKYLTEGMLVNEWLRDPWLKVYSCVVLDEVHERSVAGDLCLGLLGRMLEEREEMMRRRGGQKLKVRSDACIQGHLIGLSDPHTNLSIQVVVMSATLDSDEIQHFFEERLSGRSRTDQDTAVKDSDESTSSWSGFSDDEAESPSQCTPTHQKPPGNASQVTAEHVPGRQHPVELTYLPAPVDDVYDAAVEHALSFHLKEPLPGDILIFLTGQEDVESVCSMLVEKSVELPPQVPKLLILPLYAALGPSQQQAVFHPTPRHARKIIVSTNIAESSVTIPGIRIVVDNGLVKVKEHRSSLGLDSLLVKPISKSAAIQRMGRAGREGPGKCLRLYTEQSYLDFAQDNTPEILRTSLAGVVLTMKARGIDDIVNFPFLSPPPRESLRSALLQLLRLGALGDDGTITKIGSQMAGLPLPPPLSRVLISAATSQETNDPVTSVALAAIDVVAALVSEPFFTSLENLTEASAASDEEIATRLEARKSLERRQGDHLTYLAAIRAYSTENTDRKLWCERHLVNHRTMKSVMAVRKQLRAMLVSLHLLPQSILDFAEALEAPGSVDDTERIAWLHPSETLADGLLKFLVFAFSGNVAWLCKDGAYRTVEGNRAVRVHPASVMAGRKVEAIVYSELVFTKRSYARGVSAVRLRWMGEMLGL